MFLRGANLRRAGYKQDGWDYTPCEQLFQASVTLVRSIIANPYSDPTRHPELKRRLAQYHLELSPLYDGIKNRLDAVYHYYISKQLAVPALPHYISAHNAIEKRKIEEEQDYRSVLEEVYKVIDHEQFRPEVCPLTIRDAKLFYGIR